VAPIVDPAQNGNWTGLWAVIVKQNPTVSKGCHAHSSESVREVTAAAMADAPPLGVQTADFEGLQMSTALQFEVYNPMDDDTARSLVHDVIVTKFHTQDPGPGSWLAPVLSRTAVEEGVVSANASVDSVMIATVPLTLLLFVWGLVAVARKESEQLVKAGRHW